MLYDAVADGLTEDDYSTTDWDSAKGMLNDGRIATMVIGAWAAEQTRKAGPHPADVAYMLFPMTVGGKKYARLIPDYTMAINRNASSERQQAVTVFVKWMTEESGFYKEEQAIPTQKSNHDMPELYEHFADVTMLADKPGRDGEENLLNDVSSDSELGIVGNDADALRDIVVQAATKGKTYNSIMDAWNRAWGVAVRENAGN